MRVEMKRGSLLGLVLLLGACGDDAISTADDAASDVATGDVTIASPDVADSLVASPLEEVSGDAEGEEDALSIDAGPSVSDGAEPSEDIAPSLDAALSDDDDGAS